MARRAGFLNSPLANPESLIHKLAASIGEMIYMPNPDMLYAALGVVAATCLKGPPVWLIFVGPPSSGKTLALNMLNKIARIHSIDMIESVGALISGTSTKERTKESTGGLLRQVGKRGIMSIKDWTCMMSLNRDAMVKVIGAMRRVFDGSFERPVGSDGAKILRWTGRAGLLSACTAAIDTHHQILSELGMRWMYFRLPESDGYGETNKALKSVDQSGDMEYINDLVAQFFEDVGLYWVDEGIDKRELSEAERNRIYSMGALVSAARSSVSRDWRTKEITAIKETEGPARLSESLGQLYVGLEFIGLDEAARWRILGKCALDSMPGLRREIVLKLSKGPAITAKDLRTHLKCSPDTVRFAAEDLMLHGVVEQAEKGERMGDRVGSYRLTAWAKRHMGAGWK